MEIQNLNYEKENNCSYRITFEVPQVELKTVYDRELKAYAGAVQIKGFRKGKAPLSLIEGRFKGNITHNMLDKVYSLAVMQSVSKVKDIDTTKQSVLSIKILKKTDYVPDNDMKFEVKVEVTPKITLNKYKGLPYSRKEAVVDDEMIDKHITRYREANAMLEAVEREAKPDDFVIADITCKDEDGNPVDNLTGSNLMFYLSDKIDNVIETQLIKGLIGLKAGEETKINIAVPDDFQNEKIKGKKLEALVKVHTVKEKKLPEIDDELAKNFACANVEEMRKKIAEGIKNELEAEYENEAQANLLEKLRAENPIVDLPELLVNEEYQKRLSRFEQYLQNMKLSKEDYEKRYSESYDDVLKNIKRLSNETVHTSLLLMDIAREEKIEASNDDIVRELSYIAYRNNTSLDIAIENAKKNDELHEIKNNVLKRKTLQLIIENAEKIESK